MRTWFEQLFGFNEKAFTRNQLIENFRVSIDEKFMTSLYCQSNSQIFHIGRFTTPSLQELRDEFDRNMNILASPALIKSKSTDLTRFQASKVSVRHEAISDIMELHAKVTSPSTFQAASQFNCLEFPSPDCIPENGISDYIYDNTQGPACAIAAAAGTLYRNYLLPMPWKGSYEASFDNCTQFGQSADMQINNFDTAQSYIKELGFEPITIRNGYSFGPIREVLKFDDFLLEMNGVMMKLDGGSK